MSRTKETVYRGVILFLIILIVILFAVIFKSNESYSRLLDTNEKLYQSIQKVQEQKEGLVGEWAEDYHLLYLEYENLFNEYGSLVEENESYKTKASPSGNISDYNLTHDEIYLLAQCVEAETGCIGYSTDLEQQYACQVILNRLNSVEFPNTIREVIYQKLNGVPQFSVSYNGMMGEHSDVDIKTLANVYSVLAYGTDLPQYVTYFYSAEVKENYVNTLPTYTIIGRTVFAYKDRED